MPGAVLGDVCAAVDKAGRILVLMELVFYGGETDNNRSPSIHPFVYVICPSWTVIHSNAVKLLSCRWGWSGSRLRRRPVNRELRLNSGKSTEGRRNRAEAFGQGLSPGNRTKASVPE